LNSWLFLPILWGQAQVPAPTAPGTLSLLALRRWCASLTLSAPDPIPRPFGLWAWLGGLAALLLVALVAQGPLGALRQLLDVPGHVRLVAAAIRRLRRAGRLVAVVLGVTVLAWTANQAIAFSRSQGEGDVLSIRKTKGLGELAIEQGVLAALTPMRDVFGLGDTLLLLIIAASLVFRVSADRWAGADVLTDEPPASAGWTTLYWGCAWLYVLYRIGAMIDPGDLPLGGCVMLEAGLVPFLMVMSDGLLLAWALVELRNASLGESGAELLDVRGTLALVPGSVLACLTALPARVLATGALLSFLHVPSFANGVPASVYTRLAWSLVAVQGAALVTAGLAGAVPWTRGSLGGAIRGYVRLLAAEGGHIVAVLALSGLAAGSFAGLAYLLVLSLPPQNWVLAAADSYAHYATLPIGLMTLAALVELGERSLPIAKLAEPTVQELAA
jgi:hypothetical protein